MLALVLVLFRIHSPANLCMQLLLTPLLLSYQYLTHVHKHIPKHNRYRGAGLSFMATDLHPEFSYSFEVCVQCLCGVPYDKACMYPYYYYQDIKSLTDILSHTPTPSIANLTQVSAVNSAGESEYSHACSCQTPKRADKPRPRDPESFEWIMALQVCTVCKCYVLYLSFSLFFLLLFLPPLSSFASSYPSYPSTQPSILFCFYPFHFSSSLNSQFRDAWKELWDQRTEQAFYFNRITGE